MADHIVTNRLAYVPAPWSGRPVNVAWYKGKVRMVYAGRTRFKVTPGVVVATCGLVSWRVRHVLPMNQRDSPWLEVYQDGDWKRTIPTT